MKHTLLIGVSALALIACKDDNSSKVETRTTAGGWTYQFIEVPDAHGTKITIGAPSNWHYNEKNPMIALVGTHLIDVSGYGDVLPVDKAAMMENMSSYAGISDDSDTLWFNAYIEKEELETVGPIFIGTKNSPNFDADELSKIKESYRNYLIENATQTGGQATYLYTSEVTSGTPFYLGTNSQTVENLDATTIEKITKWYGEISDLGGLKIGIAGNEAPKFIEPFLDEILSNFNPDAPAKTIPDWTPNFSGRTIWLERADIEKSLLLFGAPWPTDVTNIDESVSQLASSAIGGGDQAIINRLIREKLRASYGMDAGVTSSDKDHYSFLISGEIDPSKQADVINVIKEIIDDVKANGITEEAFNTAKESMLLHIEEAQKDENFMAYVLTSNLLSSHPDQDIYAQVDEIKAMTYEDTNAKIKERMPSFEQFVKVVVSPNSDGLTPDCALKTVEELAQCEN